jgi:hypothetical protein
MDPQLLVMTGPERGGSYPIAMDRLLSDAIRGTNSR